MQTFETSFQYTQPPEPREPMVSHDDIFEDMMNRRAEMVSSLTARLAEGLLSAQEYGVEMESLYNNSREFLEECRREESR